MGVCLSRDEYVGDLYWVAYLNNGQTVYRDDGREGEYPSSAWLRLKEYVEENNLYIQRMTAHFRSNWFEVYEPEAEGYYFSNGVLAQMMVESCECFVMGTMKNNEVKVVWLMTPELIVRKEEIKKPENCNQCLITKNTHQNILLVQK